MAKVIPAILTKSEEDYVHKLKLAENVSDIVQVDFVDGRFAKNITINPLVVTKHPTTSQIEAQIMAIDVDTYIQYLLTCHWVTRIIVPCETRGNLNEIIYLVKKNEKKIGISFNPKTPVTYGSKYFGDIDLALLLAVEPGFSGQKLHENVFDKIHFIRTAAPGLAIEVDGGINFDNAGKLAKSGAHFLAANSVIFGADDFRVAYEKLANLASQT